MTERLYIYIFKKIRIYDNKGKGRCACLCMHVYAGLVMAGWLILNNDIPLMASGSGSIHEPKKALLEDKQKIQMYIALPEIC